MAWALFCYPENAPSEQKRISRGPLCYQRTHTESFETGVLGPATCIISNPILARTFKYQFLP
jgi:hypothetical protein